MAAFESVTGASQTTGMRVVENVQSIETAQCSRPRKAWGMCWPFLGDRALEDAWTWTMPGCVMQNVLMDVMVHCPTADPGEESS